jgi:pimeloyl-ACP methyl ester carboxylesterase
MSKDLLRKLSTTLTVSTLGFGIGMAHLPAARADQPMVLAKFGSYFVSGDLENEVINNGYPSAPGGVQHCIQAQRAANQMYVAYIVPQNTKHTYPIVLVHGGGLTGKSYEETPDGREGWVNFFVRQGFNTYWVDKPWRGRSTINPTPINSAQCESNPTLVPLIESPFGTSATDQLQLSAVPDFCPYLNNGNILNCGAPFQNALIALLEKIGPAVVVGHSQGGPDVYLTYERRPDLFAGVILAEPDQQPTSDFNAQVWAKAPVLSVWSKPAPYAVAEGTVAGFTTQAAAINSAGGDATVIALPDFGIPNATHFMMNTATSDQVAQVLDNWITQHVDSKKK